MNEQETDQKLKAERVQARERGPAVQKKPPRPATAIGPVPTQCQASQRLKAERVQSRLKRLPGWQMQSGGRAIDRVRHFPDAQVAASYLAYAAQLAGQRGQPLQAAVNGSTVVVALPGRSTRPGGGITEDVLDLAEQLG